MKKIVNNKILRVRASSKAEEHPAVHSLKALRSFLDEQYSNWRKDHMQKLWTLAPMCTIFSVLAVIAPTSPGKSGATWQEVTSDYLEGSYIKWKDGQTHRVTFLHEEPKIEPGQTPDGKTIEFWKCPVILHDNGRDRQMILSTSSKGLIRQLLAHDKIKPLQGRTFDIKAIGDGKLRRFEVTPID